MAFETQAPGLQIDAGGLRGNEPGAGESLIDDVRRAIACSGRGGGASETAWLGLGLG